VLDPGKDVLGFLYSIPKRLCWDSSWFNVFSLEAVLGYLLNPWYPQDTVFGFPLFLRDPHEAVLGFLLVPRYP
jgi:hypothetical protein